MMYTWLTYIIYISFISLLVVNMPIFDVGISVSVNLDLFMLDVMCQNRIHKNLG